MLTTSEHIANLRAMTSSQNNLARVPRLYARSAMLFSGCRLVDRAIKFVNILLFEASAKVIASDFIVQRFSKHKQIATVVGVVLP